MSAEQTPTPRIRGYKWMVIRERQLKRYPLCSHCLRQGHAILAEEVDHKVPLFKGGSNDASNLDSICRTHHKAKTLIDKGYTSRGSDANGMPTDPNHCWYDVRNVDAIKQI